MVEDHVEDDFDAGLMEGANHLLLNGVPVHMGVGECWYLNVNLAHRAANRSPIRRVHLVLDCRVNDWLTELFDEAVAGPTA